MNGTEDIITQSSSTVGPHLSETRLSKWASYHVRVHVHCMCCQIPSKQSCEKNMQYYALVLTIQTKQTIQRPADWPLPDGISIIQLLKPTVESAHLVLEGACLDPLASLIQNLK